MSIDESKKAAKLATALGGVVNREHWLALAVEELRHDVFTNYWVPPLIRVSCGWPSKGGTSRGRRMIGECWGGSHRSADGATEIFISPVLADEEKILETLVHEMVHASDDCRHGHKGRFVRIATAVGLTPPWRTAPAGTKLTSYLKGLAKALGPYPGAALSADKTDTQGTRLLKGAVSPV
jgi:SprT-like family